MTVRIPYPLRGLAIASAIALSLSGCPQRPESPPDGLLADTPQPVAVGGDRDAHGCIASAGYAWCERERACARPWELAKDKGFENEAESFRRYCDATPRTPEPSAAPASGG